MADAILDSDRKPTHLQTGDQLIFRKNGRAISLARENRTMYWPNGDDKMSLPCVKTYEDFLLFAQAIAYTHGFGISQTRVSNDIYLCRVVKT